MRYYLYICLLLYSCNLKNDSTINKDTDEEKSKIDIINTKTNAVKDCIPNYLDTINKNFSVTYVSKNSYFIMNLKIENVFKEISNLKFDCHDQNIRIPRFKSYYKDWLCLKRGCGNDCEIIYLFNNKNKKLNYYYGFENVYDIDLKNAIVIILNQDDYSNFLAINYLKMKCFKVNWKANKNYDDIFSITLTENKINIKYNDSTHQKIKFNGSDFVEELDKYPISTKSVLIDNFKR